mgnify:CR=1 FL=1
MRGRLGWLGLGLLAIGLACAGGPDTTAGKGKKGKKGKRKAKTEQVEAPAEQPASGGGGGEKAAKTGGSDTPPDGITTLSSTSWQVERQLVDKWESKPERFASVSQKGKGFVMKKVGKKDARFVGFKNGDVLRSVNGKSLGSPAEAAAAYAQLQGAKTLKVKFRRDGAARTHTLKIVD